MIVLIKWLFVHLFIDFVVQTKSMVAHKRKLKARSWYLYIHCLLQGGLVYLLTPGWQLWQIPLIITVSHFLIDLWKINRKENALYFIIDQALHLIVLFALWNVFIAEDKWLVDTWERLKDNMHFWLTATGYLVVTFPLSILMYYATQRWRKSVEKGDWGASGDSLSDAGKWIGIFERLLVYTFIITNHIADIGFLIAAKSIIRFNDIKGSDARKEAEYVLIGTLMSFSSSILVGLIVRSALNSL
jgi:hypothetical protein